MRLLRPVFAGSLVLSVAVGALAPAAHADPPPTPAEAGVAWLITQQVEDGSFETAGFPGFETPDAVLAIAANAQTTSTWSTSEALAAVQAVKFEGTGPTALDWLDDWVDGVIPDTQNPGDFLVPLPGQLAKLVILVAQPLEGPNISPTDFDPSDDSAEDVDLTTALDDISPGLFNSFIFARMAEQTLGQNVHQTGLQIICEAAKAAGGGWSFDGDPGVTNAADLDTTGFAVMALRSIGVAADDAVLDAAGDFVTAGQQANGSWQSFGSDDANATVLAMWALASLGVDVNALSDSPFDYLESQQLAAPPADAGRIQSPNDFFGVNTFATAQGVQGLLLATAETGADWLPPAAGGGRSCLPAEGYSDVAATTWFEDAARWVDAEDIVGGINGAFRANGNVNRAQAAQWLNQMFGNPDSDPNTFTDVPDGAWYEAGVDFVGDAPNGVIATGFGGQFRPRLNLNRAQAVSWLYAAAGSPDVTSLPDPDFSDVGANAWFLDAATWAKANGIVAGFGDGSFGPNRNVTRAQMAQWLFNLAAEPGAWDVGSTLASTILFTPPT